MKAGVLRLVIIRISLLRESWSFGNSEVNFEVSKTRGRFHRVFDIESHGMALILFDFFCAANVKGC